MAESAIRLRQLGAETVLVGSSAPGYDGQLGPRIHDLSLEATAPITAKADRLAELSLELMALATAFAEADRESVGLFERLGDQLLDWLRQADDRPRCAFESYLHGSDRYRWPSVPERAWTCPRSLVGRVD